MRACLRTARDARLSTAAGRPMSAPNLRRLLQRRLGDVLARPVSSDEAYQIAHQFGLTDVGKEVNHKDTKPRRKSVK